MYPFTLWCKKSAEPQRKYEYQIVGSGSSLILLLSQLLSFLYPQLWREPRSFIVDPKNLVQNAIMHRLHRFHVNPKPPFLDLWDFRPLFRRFSDGLRMSKKGLYKIIGRSFKDSSILFTYSMHGRSGRLLLWTTIFSQNPGTLWQSSASSNCPQSQMDGTLCTVLSPVGQIGEEKQTLVPRVQQLVNCRYLVSPHFHTYKYWNMMKHVSMMWHVPFNLTVSSFHRPPSSVQSLGWQLDIRGMPPGKCMFWTTIETAIGCPSLLAFFKHSIHSPGLRGATKLMMNLGMMPCPTSNKVQ